MGFIFRVQITFSLHHQLKSLSKTQRRRDPQIAVGQTDKDSTNGNAFFSSKKKHQNNILS